MKRMASIFSAFLMFVALANASAPKIMLVYTPEVPQSLKK